PDVHFPVYGDGELRQELINYANEIGLDGKAVFVGSFSGKAELAQIMRATDIFVVSSILEGQPLSVVEAMSFGCPIVATAVGGIPELIADGINGLLCMPADPECLATKIRVLIDNPNLREDLARAARKTYEQGSFQPKVVCDRFISVYQQVLGKERINVGTDQEP
ncbi:MAG: glycosyltransferase family 4 protein, partial [Acidimicrobiales bacterium]